MAIGTVKFFDEDKGYGFIVSDNGGNDIFVHKSALEGSPFTTLLKEQRVNFETEKDRKNGKIKAVNLSAA